MTTVESPRVPDPKSGTDENSAAVAILRRLDGPIRKSLRASELTAVQHALPKTSLSHAILHENPSHARHLNLHMSQLQRRRLQVAASQENSRKAFIDHQHRKHRTWKSQDETKAAAMNFPVLKTQNNNGGNAKNNGFNNGNNSGENRLNNSQNIDGNGANNGQNNQNNQNHLSASEQRDVMYKSPRYMLPNDVDPTDGTPRLMPYMSVRRERTEFLSYQQKTYMLRLPTVIVSDGKKMARYDDYCGKTMLDLGKPAQDDRFQKLANSLSASAAHESVVTARDFASAREYTSSASRDKQHTSRDNNNNQPHASQQHNHLVTQQQQQQSRQGSNLPPMSSGTTTNTTNNNSSSAPQPPASSSAAPGDAASNALRDHPPPGAAPPPQGLLRERAHTNLARAKTKGDLKGQSVDDLRHKYGHLKSSYDNKDKDASDSGPVSRKVQPKAQSDKR